MTRTRELIPYCHVEIRGGVFLARVCATKQRRPKRLFQERAVASVPDQCGDAYSFGFCCIPFAVALRSFFHVWLIVVFIVGSFVSRCFWGLSATPEVYRSWA